MSLNNKHLNLKPKDIRNNMKQYDKERRNKTKEIEEYKSLSKQLKMLEERALIQQQINKKKQEIENQKRILQSNSKEVISSKKANND